MMLTSLAAHADDGVVTYRACVANNGPDLMLITVDARSGSELWSKKIFGWDSTPANWDLCLEFLKAQ